MFPEVSLYMKAYRPSYFLGTGIKSFFRNGVMSTASIIILVCSLIICCSSVLLVYNIDRNIDSIGDFNEIRVYADLDATDMDLQYIEGSLDYLQEQEYILSYTFVSKEESLEIEKENYGEDYHHLFDSYGTDNNPLPDSYRIIYNPDKDFETLEYELAHIDSVDDITNKKDIADNISKVKQVILFVCTALTGMLLVISIFIISNTIRLTLKYREIEINIMRYIGATKFFIRTPFMIESILIALLSAAIAYILQFYSYKYVTENIIADYGIFTTIPFSEVQGYVIVGFIAVSVLFSLFGTAVSIRKYLKA